MQDNRNNRTDLKKPVNNFHNKANQHGNENGNTNKPKKEPLQTVMTRTKAALSGKEPENIHLKFNAFAEMIVDDKNRDKFKFPEKKEFSVNISKNIQDLFACLKNQKDVSVRDFSATTASRLIVGLGAESVYEVSIALHHIYGTPYIPGQSLKGAVRNFVIAEHFGKNEDEALKDKEFCAIFGKQDGAGKVMFYDVYPENGFKLEKDTMTPHYSDYYSGKNEWPTDTEEPTPIPFLAIPGNVKFRFFLGVKKGGEELLDKAREYLKNALENSGVGAKTAVGYGYFKDFNEVK